MNSRCDPGEPICIQHEVIVYGVPTIHAYVVSDLFSYLVSRAFMS